MTICNVLTEFNLTDLPLLLTKLSLNEFLIFTDDLEIKNEISKHNPEIFLIDDYFGEITSELMLIYARAVKDTELLTSYLLDVKYDGIRIIDGLKSYILQRLIFVEKIISILQKQTNILFLFKNNYYFYYTLYELAKEFGYDTHFGVSKIIDEKIINVDFQTTFTSYFNLLYNQSNFDDKFEETQFNLNLQINFEQKFAQYGFFLINNDEDFYLKPIYPVLQLFKDKQINFIIFTFSKNTTIQLQEKGYQVFELTSYIDNLETIMIQNNESIISNFYKKINEIHTTNLAVRNYLKVIKNDRITRDISRVLSVIYIIKQILNEFNLRSILIQSDGVSENDIVCKLSLQYGIPSYSTPSGLMRPNPLIASYYNASKLLISGNKTKKLFIEMGINEERLIVTGNPQYDYIKTALIKSTAQKNHSRKLILIAMSRIHKNDDIWISELIHFCNASDFDIVIKLHPSFKFLKDLENLFNKKIQKIKNNCFGLKYSILYEANLQEILGKTDVLITDYSLVAAESSLQNIPIITINFDDEKIDSSIILYDEYDISLKVSNMQELIKNIQSIINDGKILEKLENGRKVFNFDFNYLNDGMASERIVKILTNNTNI